MKDKVFNLKEVLDKTKEEAIQVLEKKGTKWRILREDDQHYVLTADYDMSRCNMVIESGTVVESWFG